MICSCIHAWVCHVLLQSYFHSIRNKSCCNKSAKGETLAFSKKPQLCLEYMYIHSNQCSFISCYRMLFVLKEHKTRELSVPKVSKEFHKGINQRVKWRVSQVKYWNTLALSHLTCRISKFHLHFYPSPLAKPLKLNWFAIRISVTRLFVRH